MTEKSYIAITGATGWVGRTSLELLTERLALSDSQYQIVLFSSKHSSLAMSGRHHGKIIHTLPLRDFPKFAEANSIQSILHTAFLTKDRIPEIGISDFVSKNKEITDLVCEGLKHVPTARVVSISSGAARYAGKQQDPKELLKSDPYAALKYEEEQRICSLTDAFVMRIYALTGRYIRDPLKFAIGDFLHQALLEKSIKITSSVPVIRGYSSAFDVCSLAVSHLLGDINSSYSVLDCVSHTISLVDLAELVSNLYGLRPPSFSFGDGGVPSVYTSSSDNFISALQSINLCPMSMEQQIMDTASGISQYLADSF